MKISVFFLLSFVLGIFTMSSQNLLHYAISTNGEKGECLFPEDEAGNVVFSKIVEIPSSADSIMTAADDFIMSKNTSDKCVIKKLSSSSRTSTYSIQLNIGKQTMGVDFWGGPLFTSVRDASHIFFKCIIEARKGKFKYTFFDFETNRNTLEGEAKNDGQPNVIHWQRVNSLSKERDKFVSSHNIESRTNKEKLFDYNSQIAYEACLYQMEYDATMAFVNGLDNLKIDEDDFLDDPTKDADFDKKLGKQTSGKSPKLNAIIGFGPAFFSFSGGVSLDSYLLSAPSEKIQSSNYNNYKGFLLSTGNNVYVRGNENNYEQAAVQELIKQIMIDGYWNVVYDIEQAHFVIDYIVDLKGRDKAHLRITTPKGDINYTPRKLTEISNESVSRNRAIARTFYLSYIDDIAKDYLKGKIAKPLEIFNIK